MQRNPETEQDGIVSGGPRSQPTHNFGDRLETEYSTNSTEMRRRQTGALGRSSAGPIQRDTHEKQHTIRLFYL